MEVKLTYSSKKWDVVDDNGERFIVFDDIIDGVKKQTVFDTSFRYVIGKKEKEILNIIENERFKYLWVL